MCKWVQLNDRPCPFLDRCLDVRKALLVPGNEAVAWVKEVLQ